MSSCAYIGEKITNYVLHQFFTSLEMETAKTVKIMNYTTTGPMGRILGLEK